LAPDIRGHGVSSYQFLSDILVEKYNVQAQAVRPEATLTELGLDSLSLAELLFDLEDKFDIEVPEDRADLSTLGEAAALVDELIRAKTA
jgi:acyl carrier protein